MGQTFWLTVTNIVLGLAVVLLTLGVCCGVLCEFVGRIKRRREMRRELDRELRQLLGDGFMRGRGFRHGR